MNIGIDIKQVNNGVMVFIQGEVDVYTAPRLKVQIDPLIEKNSEITVDLTGVNYMDSTGLGVFIGLLKNIEERDGALKLVGLSERLQRLFTITGLSELMNVTSRVEGEAR